VRLLLRVAIQVRLLLRVAIQVRLTHSEFYPNCHEFILHSTENWNTELGVFSFCKYCVLGAAAVIATRTIVRDDRPQSALSWRGQLFIHD
jgi:hypothetical protein